MYFFAPYLFALISIRLVAVDRQDIREFVVSLWRRVVKRCRKNASHFPHFHFGIKYECSVEFNLKTLRGPFKITRTYEMRNWKRPKREAESERAHKEEIKE